MNLVHKPFLMLLAAYGLFYGAINDAMEKSLSLIELVQENKIDQADRMLDSWRLKSGGNPFSDSQIAQLTDAFALADKNANERFMMLIFNELLDNGATSTAEELISRWSNQPINPSQLAVLRAAIKSAIERQNNAIFATIINTFRMPDVYLDALEEAIRTISPAALEAFINQLETSTLIVRTPSGTHREMTSREREDLIKLLQNISRPGITHQAFRRLTGAFSANTLIPLVFSLVLGHSRSPSRIQ